jgi:hypothetical protein
MKKTKFKRNPASGNKNYRKLFVIASEGGKTEPTYFLIFNKIVNIKSLTPKSSPPKAVLGCMKKYLEDKTQRKEDQYWLVIDKDHWTEDQITPLYQWAKKETNRGLALSNPNFEYWLLLHFHHGNDLSSTQAILKKLKEFFPKYKKSLNVSEKQEIIKNNFEAARNAIKNAQKKDSPPCEDWPKNFGVTTVYRLVEKIMEGMPMLTTIESPIPA